MTSAELTGISDYKHSQSFTFIYIYRNNTWVLDYVQAKGLIHAKGLQTITSFVSGVQALLNKPFWCGKLQEHIATEIAI